MSISGRRFESLSSLEPACQEVFHSGLRIMMLVDQVDIVVFVSR